MAALEEGMSEGSWEALVLGEVVEEEDNIAQWEDYPGDDIDGLGFSDRMRRSLFAGLQKIVWLVRFCKNI